jgi:hypothetical protein
MAKTRVGVRGISSWIAPLVLLGIWVGCSSSPSGESATTGRVRQADTGPCPRVVLDSSAPAGSSLNASYSGASFGFVVPLTLPVLSGDPTGSAAHFEYLETVTNNPPFTQRDILCTYVAAPDKTAYINPTCAPVPGPNNFPDTTQAGGVATTAYSITLTST